MPIPWLALCQSNRRLHLPSRASGRCTGANRTFPAEERYGLVWSSLNATNELPKILALEQGPPF